MTAEWMPEVYAKSQPIWCPNCGEEFGIEKEIEYAEKRGIQHILEYLIANKGIGVSINDDEGGEIMMVEVEELESMLKQLEKGQ